MTHRRFIHVFFLAVFIFSFLSSAAFIALEYNHECNDDDCPVCFQIHVCMNTLRALTLISLAVLALLVIHDDSLRNISSGTYHGAESDLSILI